MTGRCLSVWAIWCRSWPSARPLRTAAMPPQTERVVTLGGDANTTALPRPLMAESRSRVGLLPDRRKGHNMSTTLVSVKYRRLAPWLVTAAAAIAIGAAAPTAAAANGPTCSGNICQSPGNVQINNAPPPARYYPYGDMPFLLGGHGGLRG